MTADHSQSATATEQEAKTGALPLIVVLGPDSLVTAYNWTSSVQGNVEAVTYCQFDYPGVGPIDAYAKFYHPASRGLVNELTGYILARHCGLPVPERAFIAIFPLAKLPLPLEGVTAQAKAIGRDWLPAFCTQDVAATGVRPLVDNDTLKGELLRWKPLPDCVAFDEHAANADRHCRNLVRRAMRDYVLIDHGRLAWRSTAPEWNAKTLDPLAEYDNRLSHILWDHKPDPKDASAIMACAAGRTSCLEPALAELRDWWSKLVPDAEDQKAWETFITERVANVEYLVRRRYGLLA